jgi:regulator of sirC expression with transglutaminase-like and TPR domain
MTRVEESEELLRRIGDGDGAQFDLAEAALALASCARPQAARAPYRAHLAELARDIATETEARQAVWASPAAELAGRVECLQDVLAGRHAYKGDDETYDDLQNADLMRVIDRRCGLPVTLGILFIHGARSQGWEMTGLVSPGHFLVRIQHEGLRAILDPFNGGRVLDTAGLRALARAAGSEELTPAHYAPVSDRDVLLRLQNNLKLRLIQGGELAEAARLIDRMLLFAPGQVALWREAGVIHAQLGNLRAATTALERFIVMAAEGKDRHEAAILLHTLKSQLH